MEVRNNTKKKKENTIYQQSYENFAVSKLGAESNK